jgi:hypothetical protein
MPEHDKRTDGGAPTFVVRNIEELVALAQWPRALLAEADLVEPAEMDELDSIRQLREFVLDATVDGSIYRSAT